MTRICRDCGEEKPLTTEFFEKRSDNGLYRHICLSCLRAQQRERYDKAHREAKELKAKRIAEEDSLFNDGKHKCQKCNQVQNISQFNVHKMGRLGLDTTCKNCKQYIKDNTILNSGALRTCRNCCKKATNIDELDLFVKTTNGKFGRYNLCKTCNNKASEKCNTSIEKRVKKFGISVDEYNSMIAKQNNSCAICKKHKDAFKGRGNNFHIDHCHTSGKVRGLLCSHCNTGLGQFKDNIQSLENAIQYISESIKNV